VASAIEVYLLALLSSPTVQSVPSGGITVSSTSDTTTVFSWTVAPVTYEFRAVIGYTTAVNAGTPSVELVLSGGAATSFVGHGFTYIGGGVTPGATWKTAAGITFSGPTLTSGDFYQFILEGTITFSAGGTFAIEAGTSSGSDTWTIQQGSKMSLVPQP
jgi:hypothetical protein